MLKEHFSKVKQEFGEVKGIGVYRFSYLHNALTQSANDLKEVFKLLSDSFQRVLNEVHILTLDETVIGFQPSKSGKRREKQAWGKGFGRSPEKRRENRRSSPGAFPRPGAAQTALLMK